MASRGSMDLNHRGLSRRSRTENEQFFISDLLWLLRSKGIGWAECLGAESVKAPGGCTPPWLRGQAVELIGYRQPPCPMLCISQQGKQHRLQPWMLHAGDQSV